MIENYTPRHGKAKLYAALIIFMFIAPLIGAVLLYINRDHFHLGTTNQGHLINAPIDLSHLSAIGKTNKWRLVYLSSKNCDEPCTKNIYYINQIHTALAKKMREVTPTVIAREHQELTIPYTKIDYIHLNESDIAWLNDQLPLAYQISTSGNFFLIDPNNLLMMYYPNEVLPKPILKDLQRLIRS